MSSKLSFTPAANDGYADLLNRAEIAQAPAAVLNATGPVPTYEPK